MGERPVGAGEHGSPSTLQAEQAVPVPVNSTDHVRGQRAAGVLADVLSFGADLRVLFGDCVGDGGVDGAGQVDERFRCCSVSF